MTKQPMAERPQRSETGVVVCAVTDGARVRLVFDDVRASTTTFPQDWQTTCFFTETTFGARAFDEGKLGDEELAGIGRAIVARLAALRETR